MSAKIRKTITALFMILVCSVSRGQDNNYVGCTAYYYAGVEVYSPLWNATGRHPEPQILRRVYEWRPTSDSEKIIFDSNNGGLFPVEVREGRIAFIVQSSDQPWPVAVIDSKGTVQSEIHNDESILRFGWSPKGDKIAYLTGVRTEMYPNGIDGKGVWIYDLNSQASEKIADTGHEISWPSFDNCVYFDVRPDRKDHVVLHYDPRTKVLEVSDFLGVNFSRNGEYYLYYSESTGFQVFDRHTNSIVRELPGGTDLTEVLKRIGVCRWLTASRLYFPLSEPAEPVYRKRHLILDVESGELRESQEIPIGPCGENAVIVMNKGGGLALQRISQMQEVSAKDTVLSIPPHPFLEP